MQRQDLKYESNASAARRFARGHEGKAPNLEAFLSVVIHSLLPPAEPGLKE
jgi:hypothetical protein